MARGLFDVWIPAISPLGLLGRSSLATPGAGSIYNTPVGSGWNCTSPSRKYAVSGFGAKAAAWIIVAHRSTAGGVNCSVARRGGSITPIQEWDSNVNVAPFRSDGSFAGWTPYGNISEFQGKVNTFCGVISAKEKVIFSNGRGAINISNVDGLAGIESGGPFTLGGNESDGEIASPYTIIGAFLWSGPEVPTSAQLREWSSNVWQVFKDSAAGDSELLLRSARQAADPALTGVAAAVASAYGTLSTSVSLLGAAASRATAAGTLSTGVSLAGAVAARAAAAGTLSTAITLQGTAAATAIATGALSSSISLVGYATVRAVVVGELAGGTATLIGAITLRASAAGSLSTSIKLAAAAVARAYVVGTLSSRIELRGSIATVASVTGMLTAGEAPSQIDISKISATRIVIFEGSGSRIVVFEGSGKRMRLNEMTAKVPTKDGDKWMCDRDPDEESYYAADITDELADRFTSVKDSTDAIEILVHGVEQVGAHSIQVAEVDGVERTFVVVFLVGIDADPPEDWYWLARVRCANGERFDKTTWFKRMDT